MRYPCPYDYPDNCNCTTCTNDRRGTVSDRLRRRMDSRGKGTYNRGSASGDYGRSSYSMRSGVFDGLPSLSRTRDDGATEIFYQAGTVDLDDEMHGHAVIKNGKLVYRRRPGESTPDIDND